MVVFLASLLSGLGSCSRQGSTAKGPSASGASGTAIAATRSTGGNPSSKLPGQEGQTQLGTRPPASESALPPGPGAPSGPRYLNLQAPPTSLLPSDFSIGELANLKASPANPAAEPGLLATLSAFLDNLVAGKGGQSLILPGRAPLIAAILDGMPPEGRPGSPVAWRLGGIRASGEEAVASLALFAAPIDASGPPKLPPRSDGTIHARLVGTSWYVEDISFDASTLEADRPFPDPPWQPQLPGTPSPQFATP